MGYSNKWLDRAKSDNREEPPTPPANQIRILSSTSQTTYDANKAEIILNAPVIVSHNEGMKYLLKIQEALI